MKSLIKFVLAGGLLLAATGAHAAITCSIPAGVLLNFGNYDDSSASITNVSSSFSVNCCTSAPGTATTTISIAIGVSTHSGQINTRQMKNSANTDLMSYQLYITSFGGTIWGDGINGGSPLTQNVAITKTCPTGQSIVAGSAIFGSIFAQQAVSAGTYSDTLTISITP